MRTSRAPVLGRHCPRSLRLRLRSGSTQKRHAENVASGPEDTWDTISVEELEHIDSHGPPTPLLDTVNYPMHMKNLSIAQLRQLSKEIRSDLVHTVSQTGGHLGSSLGVVELTVALHHVFDCPSDKFIFDVGHQAYVHKMLTGRRHRMGTIRQYGGLSGFTKRSESEYDSFGAGHSSTSISAGVGMAVGRDAKGKANRVVSIIGDGAITGGMAYEAMNHAGFLDTNMIVILNDNQQVSLPTQYNGKNQDPVGALSSALSRLQANRPLRELREVAKGITKQLPEPVQDASAKIDEYARGMIAGKRSTLFEELGLYYIGPVDGHNLTGIYLRPSLSTPVQAADQGMPVHSDGDLSESCLFRASLTTNKTFSAATSPNRVILSNINAIAPALANKLHSLVQDREMPADLIDVLKEVKEAATVGPVLIHVVTEKGRGYVPAETASDKMHGVVKYDIVTGKQKKKAGPAESYTNVFADSLIAEAEADSRVIAIHAAMAGGTGLYRFERQFPNRIFDVGIAEQHAVTFAAGLACEGMVPWCTIYSTFLQRGYDQVVHDVALQKLPVRFAMDRAGLVGADGATHAGSFDVTYMASLPNMVTMAPSNEVELVNMIATMSAYDQGPSCVRYPRGTGIGLDFQEHGIGANMKGNAMELGKARICREGKDAAVIAYGSSTNEALEAADVLEQHGVSVTVVDARFCKPLDTETIRNCAKGHPIMITVEEGSIGGFAAHVMQFLALDGLLDGSLKFRPMTMPDRFIDHGSQPQQLADAGLDAAHIARTVLSLMGKRAALIEA